MKQPVFDIFTGTSRKNGIWLDTVEGLSNARARMEVIAANIPGQYFVCPLGSQEVLAQAETFKKPDNLRAKSNAA